MIDYETIFEIATSDAGGPYVKIDGTVLTQNQVAAMNLALRKRFGFIDKNATVRTGIVGRIISGRVSSNYWSDLSGRPVHLGQAVWGWSGTEIDWAISFDFNSGEPYYNNCGCSGYIQDGKFNTHASLGSSKMSEPFVFCIDNILAKSFDSDSVEFVFPDVGPRIETAKQQSSLVRTDGGSPVEIGTMWDLRGVINAEI